MFKRLNYCSKGTSNQFRGQGQSPSQYFSFFILDKKSRWSFCFGIMWCKSSSRSKSVLFWCWISDWAYLAFFASRWSLKVWQNSGWSFWDLCFLKQAKEQYRIVHWGHLKLGCRYSGYGCDEADSKGLQTRQTLDWWDNNKISSKVYLFSISSTSDASPFG